MQSRLALTIILYSRYSYYPYFIDKETGAQISEFVHDLVTSKW